MNSNLLGLIKCAKTELDVFQEGANIGLSIVPALLGTLGGGAAGYLTGNDEDETTGQKSTRWRNALIGALLGGSTAGAGYYGLVRNFFTEANNATERMNRATEQELSKQANKKNTEEFLCGAFGPAIASTVMQASEPRIYVPALIGLLGGGGAGYFFTKDKKNKLRNTLLSAITGATAGTLGGGVADILARTNEIKKEYSDY